MRIVAALHQKYNNTPKAEILPTSKQIESRKKSLVALKKASLGYDINTNAGFCTFVKSKEITSKAQFDSVEDKDALFIFNFPVPAELDHGIPGIFSQTALDDDNKEVDCTGAVLGSTRIAMNIITWWSVLDETLVLILDGMYKRFFFKSISYCIII